MIIMQKGLKEYFNDDPSLAEKFTYEEFYCQKDAAPANEDISIEEAFNVCLEMCGQNTALGKTV